MFGALGIALVAGSAAAGNCLLERKLDARMARTRARALSRGEVALARAPVASRRNPDASLTTPVSASRKLIAP